MLKAIAVFFRLWFTLGDDPVANGSSAASWLQSTLVHPPSPNFSSRFAFCQVIFA